MESRREKAIKQSIELMFTGMEHDELKHIMLAVALNKTDEEKDAICEQIRKTKEKDLEDMLARYTIDNVEETTNCKGEIILQPVEEEPAKEPTQSARLAHE